MIRKVRKACWLYECRTCEVSATGPDQWTPYEFGWKHERSSAHHFKVVGKAFEPMVDAFALMFKTVEEVAGQFQSLYAVPPNLPHDPSLLADRRKWGGK